MTGVTGAAGVPGSAPLYGVSDVRTIVEGLDHPEGVAFSPDGALYAGGEAGQVYCIEGWREALEGDGTARTARTVQLATSGGFMLGLALDGAGAIYACDLGRHQVLRITQEGEVSVYSGGTAGHPMRTPNYPVFDRAGRLYVSDSGAWEQNDGLIYRIDPGGATTVASTAPRHFANGLALSPDDAWLYVAESTLPGVTRLRVHPDGSLGDLEEVVRLPGTVPDGLAFDRAGNLFVACYRPDRIYRLTPSGEVAVLAEDPAGTALAAPTNVAFNGNWLAIASLGRWHLAALHLEHPGAPLHYPEVRA